MAIAILTLSGLFRSASLLRCLSFRVIASMVESELPFFFSSHANDTSEGVSFCFKVGSR